ncbi:alpha/beta hydrolase family protein [Epilithonimonas mollis]|uniref:Dipeptidyl aminopeptidase/acylaminoacyl peptidase n=1 Tax=Epilithonimonas mollis TaxID=216903 RepID=A0A1M6URK3_9FLAO|nr:prolyl oligopeptidase family serine peptidase [Epilithonimonas mollis]SHK71799.1 Dipeptidyl aminopeptidase/acylaminoacyl peptidase [Epilithonimonas mollis]
MRVFRLLIVWLMLLTGTLYDSQITADIVSRVKEEYKAYGHSAVLEISEDLEWYVLNTEKGGRSRSELYSIHNDIPTILPEAFWFKFLSKRWLIAPLKNGKTYCRNLETNKESRLDGSFKGFAISDNRLLMVNNKSGNMMILDSGLSILWESGTVEVYDVNEQDKSMVFLQNNTLIDLDILTLRKKEMPVKEKFSWIRSSNNRIWTLDDRLRLSVGYKGDSKIKTIDLELPPHLEVFQKDGWQADIREDRYLLLPVAQRKKENKELADIFYTSLSYQYRKKMKQWAVCDIQEKKWQYLPREGDWYRTQKFISDSDFISYDVVSKNYDTIGTPKVDIQLHIDWGRREKHLKSPNTERSHFFYHKGLGRLLFFDKGRWMIEDVEKGMVLPVRMPESTNFLNDKESGLTDEPWDKVELINDETVILTEEYDLYSFNLRTSVLKKLTDGRAKNRQYRLIKEKDFSEASDWVTNKRKCQGQSLMVQFFDRSDFYSGVALITADGKEKWQVKEEAYIKNAKRLKNKVFYTSSFYNKPLKISLVDSGRSGLIRENTTEAETNAFRYSIFQYPDADGVLLDAVLLYPKNYKSGEKFPMVVEVYENKSRAITNNKLPKLNDGLGFNHMHYVHQDYFVLLPQVGFKVGDLENSVTSSVTNVMQEVLKLKDIDKDRIGLIGGSFGGYEVTMLMGKTKLFKTAIAGVPVVDLPSSYLTFGKMRNQPEYWRVEKHQLRMGKNLFDNWDSYLSNSPVYHMKNIDEPMLIWIGKDDDNVNPDQGRSFFIGLKRLQKKAVLLEYPKQGHNITDPLAAEDLNIKVWQWFDYFLKDNPPADWIRPML